MTSVANNSPVTALMWAMSAHDEPPLNIDGSLTLSAAYREAGPVDVGRKFDNGQTTMRIRCLEMTATGSELLGGGRWHLVIDHLEGTQRIRHWLTDVNVAHGALSEDGGLPVIDLTITVGRHNATVVRDEPVLR